MWRLLGSRDARRCAGNRSWGSARWRRRVDVGNDRRALPRALCWRRLFLQFFFQGGSGQSIREWRWILEDLFQHVHRFRILAARLQERLHKIVGIVLAAVAVGPNLRNRLVGIRSLPVAE